MHPMPVVSFPLVLRRLRAVYEVRTGRHGQSEGEERRQATQQRGQRAGSGNIAALGISQPAQADAQRLQPGAAGTDSVQQFVDGKRLRQTQRLQR